MNDPSASGGDEQVEVRLVGFPVGIYAKAQQHLEGLLREFQLMAQGLEHNPERADELPPRLLRLISELRANYAADVADAEARIESAVSAGAEVIDEVVFRVPRRAGEAARHLGGLLNEADEYCAAGRHLFTLATPPEHRRFRDWYLGEFVRQAAGEPPISWADCAL